MKKISRRKVLALTGSSLLASSVSSMGMPNKGTDEVKRKILVFGGHPDDPETGCGGIMKLFSQKGDDVVAVYLTTGEAGIPGKSHNEAAKIRKEEAIRSCEVLGVKHHFLGQIDGDTKVDKEEYEKVFQFVQQKKPDLILTHWPVDTHRDHRACSLLAYDAWLKHGKKSAFYYYEVMTGVQSNNFYPTDYVDISSVIEDKRKSCMEHTSQLVEEWYEESHGRMETFRGMESGCAYAEAFVRHNQSIEFNLRNLDEPKPNRSP